MEAYVILEDKEGMDYGMVYTRPLKVVFSEQAAKEEIQKYEQLQRQECIDEYARMLELPEWDKYTIRIPLEESIAIASRKYFYFVVVPCDYI